MPIRTVHIIFVSVHTVRIIIFFRFILTESLVGGQAKKISSAAHQKPNITYQKIATHQKGLVGGQARSVDKGEE